MGRIPLLFDCSIVKTASIFRGAVFSMGISCAQRRSGKQHPQPVDKSIYHAGGQAVHDHRPGDGEQLRPHA